MLILSPLIFYLFLIQKIKKNIFKNKKVIFSILFLSLWLIKNIITSGCIIYPISKTCINNLSITDSDNTSYQETSGEAWSKDWSNYDSKIYTMEEYTKNLRWVKNWYNHHFKIVAEKLSPIIIFITIIYFLFSYNKSSTLKRKLIFENYIYFFNYCLVFKISYISLWIFIFCCVFNIYFKFNNTEFLFFK